MSNLEIQGHPEVVNFMMDLENGPPSEIVKHINAWIAPRSYSFIGSEEYTGSTAEDFISVIVPVIVYLRDNISLSLNPVTLKELTSLRGIVMLSRAPDIPTDLRSKVARYLNFIPTFQDNLFDEQNQPREDAKFAIEIHGRANKPLHDLLDEVNKVLDKAVSKEK